MPPAAHVTRNVDDAERLQRSPRWRAVADLATRQHGAVEHGQLVALGFSPRSIARLVAAGLLQVVHRGVYAVGHRLLTTRGRWMAAVLAVGPDADLSHRSATALHGVRPAIDRIDVTVPVRRRPRRGVVVHRAHVPQDERTVVDGIPVTGLLRTLLDVAAEDPLAAERAAHEAEARRLSDRLSPAVFLDRHAHHKGVRALRAILADPRLGLDLTESPLEDEFLAFLDEFGLPRPQLQVPLEGRRCDALWPERRLIAELDSRRWHHTGRAFEDDRARDRRLRVAGYSTVRITRHQLREDRRALAADLAVLTC